jgi:hypothetical protein
MKDRKLLIPLRYTVLGACLLFCLSVSVSCSRSEKPKAVEKKARTIEIAPTPIPSTGMVQIVRQTDTNSPHYRAPQNSISTPESQKAVRERQRAFAKKAIEQELARKQVPYEQKRLELDKKEVEIREKDPAVRDAYASMMNVRSGYEETCKKSISGYDDVVREVDRTRGQLDDALSRRRQGMNIATQDLAVLRRDFNQAFTRFNQMRLAANLSNAAVGQALIEVRDAQAAYERSLAKNDEYLKSKMAADEALAIINNLTAMRDDKKE